MAAAPALLLLSTPPTTTLSPPPFLPPPPPLSTLPPCHRGPASAAECLHGNGGGDRGPVLALGPDRPSFDLDCGPWALPHFVGCLTSLRWSPGGGCFALASVCRLLLVCYQCPVVWSLSQWPDVVQPTVLCIVVFIDTRPRMTPCFLASFFCFVWVTPLPRSGPQVTPYRNFRVVKCAW